MDPVVVRADPDPLLGLDVYDAERLLELGNEQFDQQAYDRAVTIYRRLVDEFPQSEHVPAALYNLGLAFEKLVEWEEAAAAFQRVVDEHPDAPSRRDAYFRLAFAGSKLERWPAVVDAFWGVRQGYSLDVMDELEARVGMAVGLVMQEDYLTAEREFLRALRFHEEQAKERYLPADYFVGQSRFYLGEIYARWFEAKALSEPLEDEGSWVELMGAELEEKCRLLLRAQSNFIRTIRVGHTGWATAAGYRIGSLYEVLYDQLLDVPVPTSLSESAREVYREELRKRVSVLVVKAIRVYEMSLEMAERVGEKNDWVQRTNASLDRMKQLYETQMLDG
jgi:tetratricopeptide (TPR) repeat protein